MQVLIFLRHGQAEDDDGSGDAARRLTGKGIAQADAAGRALARIDLIPDCCLTSPRERALATARAASAHLGLEPEIVEELGGGGFRAEEVAAGRGTVLLVGHEPTFSSEVGRLTGANVDLKKGGLAVVKGSTLRILATPSLLAG